MGRRSSLAVGLAATILFAACGREPLLVPSGYGGSGGSGVVGNGGSGGSGGTVILRLPDGGLNAMLGDSGILGGILDAPRDSLLGQVFCDSDAKLGAKCGGEVQGCLLPSLGGACICLNGNYLCPLNPSAGPQACPTGAGTGKSCMSPLSVCIGGAANACICGLGSYTCF